MSMRVSENQCAGIRTGGIGHGSLECPGSVAIVDENRYRSPAGIGRNHVEVVVVGETRAPDIDRIRADRISNGREACAHHSQRNAYGVVATVGDDGIGIAICIDIEEREKAGQQSRRRGYVEAEVAGAVILELLECASSLVEHLK